MWQKIVREGNAFYEIDEVCMRKKEQERKEENIKVKENRKTGKNSGEAGKLL
ncbi:MAG: hypothetical protein HP042_07745 [Lachnospiraceae bacterium]|jgi:hypothetical protein|nr:hypothetical protein [Lachnospiraceae bacterium]